MEKVKKKNKIFFILLFIIGLSIMAYPLVSEYIKNKNQTDIISQYEENVNSLSDDEIENLKKEAEAYNNRLSGNAEKTDASIESKSYVDLLNVGDVIGYIEIPKINVNLPIYHGTEETVLQKGVGHLETSSLPVGGESTHAVLTGHRGLPTSTLFTDLDKLEEGDIFYINVLNETLTYKVNQIKVVLPDETSDLQIVQGKDYVTLVTCTPYMINSHRLLVRGERTDAEYSKSNNTEKIKNETLSIRENTNQYIIIYFSAAGILMSTVYIIYYLMNIKPRKNEKEEKYMINIEKVIVDEKNGTEEIFDEDISTENRIKELTLPPMPNLPNNHDILQIGEENVHDIKMDESIDSQVSPAKNNKIKIEVFSRQDTIPNKTKKPAPKKDNRDIIVKTAVITSIVIGVGLIIKHVKKKH